MPIHLDPFKGFQTMMGSKFKTTPSVTAKLSMYLKNQGVSMRIHDNWHSHNEALPMVALPIQLFHPAFTFFSSNAFNPNYNIPNEFLHLILKFMYNAVAIYLNKETCKWRIDGLLTNILGKHIINEWHQDRTPLDRLMFSLTVAPRSFLLIVEGKCEFGDGGSDPTMQAEFSFLQAYKQAEVHCFYS